MESGARDYIQRIDEMGGMIAAIERGFPQSEIASASYRYQNEVESSERIIVGVNRFASEKEEDPSDLLRISQAAGEAQSAKLKQLRSSRNNARVEQCLQALRAAAETTQNTMPPILDAVRAYATLGEICEAFRDVFGTHVEKSIL
jgi:methylmalonyl-CoA mutase N-terminal domain/subunit